ncbi:MAG: hypothetical protein HN356_11525, partial [Calditrichaeota bacterium]|nr:hypothetical protein [Calditrichota bacterium]
MAQEITFAEKMLKLDRRIIFALIALAVIIPMMMNLQFPVRPSPIVETIFDKVESLPNGSVVLLSFDYGPSTVPENEPMGDALLYHCMLKDHKVYMMALWPTGEAEGQKAITRVITGQFPNKKYGEDYIMLGFKAGNQGLINAIFTDLKGMYTTDANGVDINSFPIMKGVDNLKAFDLILGVCSGKPGLKEWVQFAGDRGDIPVAGGVTAVEAPLLYPYYPKQLLGLMGGLQGAAELQAAV